MLVDSPLVGDVVDGGSSGFLKGMSRLPSFVLANASRLAAASASLTVTEYVGLSLLPRAASPPPGAYIGIFRSARTRAHINFDRRAALTVSFAQFDYTGQLSKFLTYQRNAYLVFDFNSQL